MSAYSKWLPASPAALSWPDPVGVGGTTGYEVGPMPDRVLVLHPLAERLDGRPINSGSPWRLDDGSHAFPATRPVRWDEYARRKNIAFVMPSDWIGARRSLPGVLNDEYIDPPDEGDLSDVAARDAILNILARHTEHGGDEMCTALYYEFWLRGDPRIGEPDLPHLLRGPLGAGSELFDRPGYVTSPQNIWPDDHSWVLYTDVDAWVTVISGSTALIDEIHDSPILETVRSPELPKI